MCSSYSSWKPRHVPTQGNTASIILDPGIVDNAEVIVLFDIDKWKAKETPVSD